MTALDYDLWIKVKQVCNLQSISLSNAFLFHLQSEVNDLNEDYFSVQRTFHATFLYPGKTKMDIKQFFKEKEWGEAH